MTGPNQRAAGRSAKVAAAFLAAAFVLVWLLPPQLLLSSPATDLVGGYVSSRAFAAQTLLSGHLPLWNPYTYGGQPFLGGFESALLYPPNLIFLCLPLARALNFSILLHLVILGWGMERWAARRGLHPGAAALAGLVLPLSGAVFPHVFAGHLSNLSTMAWAPWLFLGLESWSRQGDRRGLFLAGAAICLQILAGHIQYFFYTAVAAGIQAVVLSVAEPAARWRALPAVIACYAAAFALGAAQLLPGLAAAAEGIRQQTLDRAFVAMFSLPPENFLTILAPGFFGSLDTPVYWGRCYLWEMSLFLGAAGPVLIALALAGRNRRGVILDLIVAGLLLVLALGVHTPLFDLLRDDAPGFGRFRGWAKFIFPATLFLVLAIAAGADVLLRGEKPSRVVAWGGLIAGLITGAAGIVFLLDPEAIAGMLQLVAASRESYLPPAIFSQPDFIHDAGFHAGLSLGVAGLVLCAAGAILFFPARRPLLRWALPGLLTLEMIGFAAGDLATSHLSDAMPDALRQFIAAHPGDDRVLDLAQPNNGFLLGAGDLGGNNPSLLRRYAEFINFTQGDDPDRTSQYLDFKSIPPLYALLRFRYAFIPDARNSLKAVSARVPPLPHLLLVPESEVLPGRDAIFSAMRAASFDPRKTVLLEDEPDPRPVPGAAGAARLISAQPDELVIEADTPQPALLLLTDLYDRDWHAEPFPDSVQQSYRLMPADYVLRGVPLAAGHHHLKIVYAPESFSVGLGISLVAWALWGGGLCWFCRKNAAQDLKSRRAK
jgi:hypothetical protein